MQNASNIYSHDSSQDDDDDDGTILKTVQNNKVNIPKASTPPFKDDRPIKPMKANIESSFNEDGKSNLKPKMKFNI